MSVLLTDTPLPGVRRLTLNRPEKRNALNNELRGAIFAALEAHDSDSEVKLTSWLMGMRQAMEPMLTGDALSGREAAEKGWATRAYPLGDLEREVLAIAERVARLPTELAQINKRSVHRAMEIAGLRAAIRAGTEIQALAFQTEPSKEYVSRFRRDGQSVSSLLSERDSQFGDYRGRRS